jgi:hypothetical protein
MKKALFVMLLSVSIFARVLHVGTGQTYSSLNQAAGAANPGDTILFHQGTYSGGQYISGLQGNAANWIHITVAQGDTVIFQGGGNAWHMVDPAYVRISGFIFQGQTSNGFNIDDGGSYATPAHHIIFENCTFRDINATGNNDLLKMSGVDSFEVRHCTFLNGAAGGSGVDMVGCHNGVFANNYFGNQGSNSIQAKGGTQFIRIENNVFKDGGQRSLNLGGSTGLAYFRPDTAHFEAADLWVYSNVFTGSIAPIAYVGCTRVVVINNTIYMPENWVIRILQETVDTTRFVPCSYNTFRNNIIYLGNISTECNVGPNTLPQTFTFSNNLWYNYQNTSWRGPNLPVTDSANIVNQDPAFANAAAGNFSIDSNSPAVGMGYPAAEPILDFSGKAFASPRSIGAIEGAAGTAAEMRATSPEFGFSVFPSPSTGGFYVSCFLPEQEKIAVSVYDLLGREVLALFRGVRPAGKHVLRYGSEGLAQGVYVLRVNKSGTVFSRRFVMVR